MSSPSASQTTANYLARLERDMVMGFLHILLLAHIQRKESSHGYGLIKALEEATGRKGLWKEGTIYPVLAAMEGEGLVRSRWGEGGNAARRKYYELTAAGRQVLRLGLLQWSDFRKTLDHLLEETA